MGLIYRENVIKVSLSFLLYLFTNQHELKGGGVTQSVDRATPGEEAVGSIPAVATRSLLFGSVSV